MKKPSRKTVTHLTYSTTMLYADHLLDGTTATDIARTCRLGLNRTVQDKKMGKKTAGDEIGDFLAYACDSARQTDGQGNLAT